MTVRGGRGLIRRPLGTMESQSGFGVCQDGTRGAVVFSIGSSDDKVVDIRYDAAAQRLSVSREGGYRFSSKFDSSNAERVSSRNGEVIVDLIIDRSSVEAFVNDGEATVTERMFPTGGSYSVAVSSSGATRVETLDIWDLRSIWK